MSAQLVVALDTHDSDEALHLARKLQGAATWLKVGLELFVHAGPDIMARLADMGYKIFLDLKMYDIPNTVRGGVLSAAAAGAHMLTIHTQGGERMAQAAVEAATEARTRHGHMPVILGVTVLTSMSQGELPACEGRLEDLIPHLARSARQWGLHGIVCSGHEVASVKRDCGKDFLCLTPGIRPAPGQCDDQAPTQADDQRRVMTPGEAVALGSDFLVVGRPITRAANPLAAAQAILEDMRR